MLPVLYKIFAKLICNRIGGTLNKHQPADQAGFRSGYSCDDHLLTVVQLIEKHSEFNLPLWAAAIDFEKAFDSIEHDSLWQALLNMEVPTLYVKVLASLYVGQCGSVITDLQ
eukprot:38848-Karenia_brevis.AAC.1